MIAVPTPALVFLLILAIGLFVTVVVVGFKFADARQNASFHKEMFGMAERRADNNKEGAFKVYKELEDARHKGKALLKENDRLHLELYECRDEVEKLRACAAVARNALVGAHVQLGYSIQHGHNGRDLVEGAMKELRKCKGKKKPCGCDGVNTACDLCADTITFSIAPCCPDSDPVGCNECS